MSYLFCVYFLWSWRFTDTQKAAFELHKRNFCIKRGARGQQQPLSDDWLSWFKSVFTWRACILPAVEPDSSLALKTHRCQKLAANLEKKNKKKDQMCPLLDILFSRNSRIFTADPLEGLANCCESVYLPSVDAALRDSPVLAWRCWKGPGH